MKKILLLFMLLVLFLPFNVKALSVDENNLTIEKGGTESIGLYANVLEEVTEISFTLVYTTYDVPAYFKLENGLTDTNPNGISHKIIFSNPVSGKVKLGTIDVNVVNNPKVNNGVINIHSGKAVTNNGTVNLNSQTINVSIGEKKEEKEKKTNLLEKIESSIVTINLEDNVYEYDVKIKDNVKELDLKPIVKDSSYKVDVSSQIVEELKDNKIIIKVSDGDYVEEYKINVSIIKDKVEDIDIDNEEFSETYKYKGKWITLIVIMSFILFVGLFLNKKK